jgi:hypothetical protein
VASAQIQTAKEQRAAASPVTLRQRGELNGIVNRHAARPAPGTQQALQRHAGNRGLQQIINATAPTSSVFRCGAHACDCPADVRLLAELPVSHPQDPAELEAARVADEVMRAPAGSTTPTYAAPAAQVGGREEATTDLAPSIDDACRRGGQPLPPDSRDFMEARFGSDFRMVRVHVDHDAGQLARSLQARAFTTGTHVFFATGEFQPDSEPGRHLLAHELTHVIQQRGTGDRRDSASGRRAQTNGSHRALADSGSSRTIQRDLALVPPHPAAAGRVLTPAQRTDAIAFNNRVVGPGGADLIGQIRDVLGTSPAPAVIDEDFVNAVVTWQAMQGLIQDGQLGPLTAAPLFREIGAEKAGECKVVNGVTYVPGAPAVVAAAGGGETAHFAFDAEFENGPAAGVFPSCCEIRQFIRWNAAAAAGMGPAGVPHGGFLAGTPVDTFIEDRNAANQRYGHRSGPFSDPESFDQYLDATGARNQAFGHLYRGFDDPQVPPAMAVGQWQFYVNIVDVCHGEVRKGDDSLIRINW